MTADPEQTILAFVHRHLPAGSRHAPPAVNEVLFIYESIWALVRRFLEQDRKEEAMSWARLGVQVAELTPATRIQAINLCAWMISKCGHHDHDPLLDGQNLVRRSLSEVPWSPTEAQHLAQTWQTQPLETVQALRRLKNATRSFDTVIDRVPDGVREQMSPWLAIRRDLP
ncbi:hypothetical protein [Deinococcus navajonensis]|uniref:Uncharacterized protein n=1 Tax=Deinococcus navajonensis TaxID=309884 RepID=A0ABV8XKL8_9DEIO